MLKIDYFIFHYFCQCMNLRYDSMAACTNTAPKDVGSNPTLSLVSNEVLVKENVVVKLYYDVANHPFRYEGLFCTSYECSSSSTRTETAV